MRQFLILTATSGLSLTFGGTTALAGYCGNGAPPVMCQSVMAPPPPAPNCGNVMPPMAAPQAPAPNCKTPVVVKPGAPHIIDPVVMQSTQPMEYLRTVKFHNSPQVNIMRVYGQNSDIGLEDAPAEFAPGCHPSSTSYCGQKHAAPAPAYAADPAPIITPPYIAPAPMRAPAIRHQYGSTELIRGTAYLPTSHVNRDYDTAVRVLNSGNIPGVKGGMVPHPSMFGPRPQYTGQIRGGFGPAITPPVARPMPTQTAPTFGPGTVPAQWEKVSGPTIVDGLPATQVICRRPDPAPMPAPAPVTCVRHVLQVPVMMSGAPQGPMNYGGSRYGSNH